MPTSEEWQDAIKNARQPLPMEPELWAAGADLDTAHFVARMLRQQGYYLIRADDIDWTDIKAFNAEIHKGQDVFEDAGGFFVRAIMALFGKKPDEVMNYRKAAKALLESVDDKLSDKSPDYECGQCGRSGVMLEDTHCGRDDCVFKRPEPSPKSDGDQP